MINLTIIRNVALVIAMGMLLLAEFLHPVFHNHSLFPGQESKCITGATPCLVQGDTALKHDADKGIAHAEYPCPICSSTFLKYCASDSSSVVLYCNQDPAAVLPPQDFVFVETNFTGSPRAPPVLFS